MELKLIEILKAELEIELDMESFDINAELINYGINSSGILNIIVNIEREFGFEFKDEDFASNNFKTIQSLKTYVQKKYSSNTE